MSDGMPFWIPSGRALFWQHRSPMPGSFGLGVCPPPNPRCVPSAAGMILIMYHSGRASHHLRLHVLCLRLFFHGMTSGNRV
jgi:hypothetical protein